MEFSIFELIQMPNFILNRQFWFIGPNLPEMCFPVQSRENEYHLWIQNTGISSGSKFHLKQAILIFCTKFAQKRYFRSKTRKGEHIVISLDAKFHLKEKILIFFGQISPKRVKKLYLSNTTSLFWNFPVFDEIHWLKKILF